MIPGYSGKFLEVNLSRARIREVSFDEEILRAYVGGRGLAAKILWDRIGASWADIDPLSSRNILLFLTGPLTGYFPGGRTCISGKSPQSNGMIGSTVGGEFGVELRCAGYDGIIVTGQSEKPVYLFIGDSEAELRDANHLWGKDAKETVRILTKECREALSRRFPRYGEWKEPALLYIGPAGENSVRTACVSAKWAHAAGYGGYGAVMGSKKLKAVAVRGTGKLPLAADLPRTKRLIDAVCREAYRNELWRRWGTGAAGYEVGAKTSSEPVRNWQEEWHDEKSFGVDQFENRLWAKQYWSDFGCPTCCLKVAVVKKGKYAGSMTDNPDYELQAYLGPNLGIFVPEDNVFLASLVDDLGLCGIQTGNVLAFAAELFQKGILNVTDLGGIRLDWGCTDAFASMIRKIAAREGIGDLLAEGTYRAALEISRMKGMDVLPFAVQAKGIAIGAHGIRSGKDYPTIISYACSVQCGDHTSTTGLPISGSESEVWEIFNDSGVYCDFNGFGIPWKKKFSLYKAVTGLELTSEQWSKTNAMRILQIQRAFLLMGGSDIMWNPKTDDDNPPRFYETLPSGPHKSKTTDRAKVHADRKQYYAEAGWDENGVPTSETLKKLDLEEVDKALEKLRKLNDRTSE